MLRNAGDLYFAGARSGRAVYLTGSHTWNNFQDWDDRDPPRAFDYPQYLDFLERHGHNLIRLYVWEQAAWFPGTEAKISIAPARYLRTGPGLALDGQPRFDLQQFDPAYFARLRERVQIAAARGIYVSVMLFNGWSIEWKHEKTGNPWRGHPFNRENNVNGVDGDANGDGQGIEAHSLRNPTVTALQKAYLAKVVETLRDQENVLFEISNESDPSSVDWQYEMVRTLHELESSQPVRHPVGMTVPFPDGMNEPLFASPADWVSPHLDPGKADDPPPVTGQKVVLSDTDHTYGVGGSPRWVWKTFLRGANVLFMDPCVTGIDANKLPHWPGPDDSPRLPPPCPVSEFEDVRWAMGYARGLAEHVDLASLRPMPEVCSTGYCMAAPGAEYLVFAPLTHRKLRRLLGPLAWRLGGEPFDVDLSAASGPVTIEWVNTETGELVPGEPVTGGSHIALRAPFSVDSVMHARVQGHS